MNSADPVTPCVGEDPACPCQDALPCHYVTYGDSPAWPLPSALILGETEA